MDSQKMRSVPHSAAEMTFKPIASTIIVVCVLLIAGCSNTIVTQGGAGATASTSALFPPRPQELSMTGLDPCSVLTSTQRTQLGVGEGSLHQLRSRQGQVCMWVRFPEEPQDSYSVATDPGQGADYAIASTSGARILSVSGYGAIETQLSTAQPNTHCLLLVDVAQGQNLWVQYDYDGSAVPMTRDLACEKARNAAGMAVETLREQSGG